MREDEAENRPAGGDDGGHAVPDGGDVLGGGGADDEELREVIDQWTGEAAGSESESGGERTTIEPAATEKSVEAREHSMDTGQDGPDDGENRQEADRSADDGLDLESALSDATDDGDAHRTVGEADPDAVFEAFDEDDPEDVIAAVESGGAPDPGAEEDTVDAVNGLFEDLGDVDAEPSEPTGAEADAGAGAAADAETGAKTGTDTGADDIGSPFESAAPSPEETAGEVEGLLDDLTTVDVDETAGTSGPATAHTQPTILDAEETGATGFQWLGEDIQIFSAGGGDPDAVFEAFDEDDPEEIIAEADAEDAGVSATGLFDDMADGAVDHPDRPEPEPEDWSDDDPAPASVDATDMFDGMDDGAAATADVPEGDTAASITEDEADDGLDVDLSAGTDAAADASSDTDAPSEADDVTTFGGADSTGTGEAAVDGDAGETTAETDGLDLDLDLEDPADGADESGQTETDGDPFDVDIDLGEAEDAGSFGEADAATDTASESLSDSDLSESDLDLDLDSIAEDVETEPGTDTLDSSAASGDASVETGSASADTEEAGAAASTPKGAVEAETDVDAVFERFEEDSPADIIEEAESPATDRADPDAVEASDEHLEQLLGDLSAVSLTPVASESSSERRSQSQRQKQEGSAPAAGSEEAVDAIEGLLGDIGATELPDAMTQDDPTPEERAAPGEAEAEAEGPTFAADRASGGADPDLGAGGEDELLEQTGEDTHVAVGESEIDAFFERFSEDSPEEIAESAQVPPLEELSERDPEQVREEIAGESGPERTPEVGDDDPVEVLGPDGSPRETGEDSLSGAIREDLGAGAGEGPDRGGRTDGQERARDRRERSDGDLDDLDPDDIFETADAGAAPADGRGDERDPAGSREPEPARDGRADQPHEAAPGDTGVPSGEDIVSDARRAETQPESEPAGAGGQGGDRTRQPGAGQSGDQPQGQAADDGGAADGDDSEESPGLVGRVIAAVRGLF